MNLDFLTAALAGGGVSATLLAIAAVLGRSQLAHWLNKDMERIKSEYQAAHEAQRAAFQRDLEAYKVTLIATAERAKAEQSLKTHSAVKMIERQHDALIELSAATRDLASRTLTHCTIDFASEALFMVDHGEIVKMLRRSDAAIEGMAIFLPTASYSAMLKLRGLCLAALQSVMDTKVAWPDNVREKRSLEIQQSQVAVNQIIDEIVRRLLGMGQLASPPGAAPSSAPTTATAATPASLG